MLDRNHLNNSYLTEFNLIVLKTEEKNPFVRRVLMFMFVEDDSCSEKKTKSFISEYLRKNHSNKFQYF